jgi:diguanylate cyclase (GGDEF)-like protein
VSPSGQAINSRYLLGLWASIREAVERLGSAAASELDGDGTEPLRKVLSGDARRLADLLDGASAAELLPSSPSAPPDERPRILLVDDDRAALEALAQLFGDALDVVAVDDSTRAAELVRTQPCDVVVSDVRMPGLDGLDLLRLLREDSLQRVPCILVSAHTGLPDKLKALKAGAFDFLGKPTQPEELLARVNNAVERARELRRERVLQETDDLTGLLNRRALRHALHWAMRRAREVNAPLSLALFDQDGLKQINDAHGHSTGDAAIVRVANALLQNRRAGDFAARLGGDEFALVMPGTDVAGAERVLERIDQELATHPLALPRGSTLRLEVSHGLTALLPEDGLDWTPFLSRADSLLYACKRAKLRRTAT